MSRKKGKIKNRNHRSGWSEATSSTATGNMERLSVEAEQNNGPPNDPDEHDEGIEPDAEGAEVAPSGSHRGAAVRRDRGGTSRVGGLTIYKPGQGYYTRVGTAVGAGVLVACFWQFLYSELEIYVEPGKPWTFYMQVGIPTLVLIGLGALIYWIVGLNHRCCDFMILTEGEMKKVSWSSRKEVIGSTKVVIFTVIVMGLILFMVDVVFAWFFHQIGVLQVAPGVFSKMMSDAL